MENNVNEVNEVKVEKKEKTNSNKNKNLRIGIIVIAVLAVAIGIATYFVIHNAKVNKAIKEVTGNDIVIKANVVYLDGETKDEKVVQYDKPDKGDLIANIKIKGYGTITVRFFPEQAPLAVDNFVTHAAEGYYDGLSFHRIIADFMIQGGDPEGTGAGGDSIWENNEGNNVPFTDEYSEYLIPIRGALCMANAGANTNGSQFFIVHEDSTDSLDMLYAAFGYVIEGMDVVDAVCEAAEPTDDNGTIEYEAQPVITTIMIYTPEEYEQLLADSTPDAQPVAIDAKIAEITAINEGMLSLTIYGLTESGAEYEIATGVIAAKRHIHLTPADAEEIGVADKQIVSVKITNANRTTIFGDVVCRVHPNFAPAMHIDTDESNAASCTPGMMGEIIK